MPTEYGGDDHMKNTVQGKGPSGARKLSSSEQLRLGRLTGQKPGQEMDTNAPRKSGFMFGVDPDYPEFDWDPALAPKADQ